MKESIKADSMYYENDTLSLLFTFYPMGLMMEIKNKSAEDIIVKWDELKMNINGTEKKIEHTQILYDRIYLEKPPSMVTPRSFATDLIICADNIYTEKRSNKAKLFVSHMYPARSNSKGRKAVTHLKGQITTLFFSTQINNVDRYWVFNFSLDKIKTFPSLSWFWYDLSDQDASRIFQSTKSQSP